MHKASAPAATFKRVRGFRRGVKALLPILVALLAGCTLPEPAPGVPPCGPVVRTAAPFGEEGPLLRVYVLNDGDAEGTLCIRVNDNNPFVHALTPADASPNVDVVAEGRFTERELRVTAWVAERAEVKASGVFALTEENHLVVMHTAQNALRIDKRDEAPRFM